MEAGECSLQHQVARGGPIYLPDHIGPITMVPEFEDSVVEELKSLMTELCVDSAQISEDDLSVDELKIFTEEELVDKALKEAFQVDEQNENQSEAPEESAIIVREDDSGGINGKTDVLEGSEKEGNTSVSDETLRESLVEKENGGNSEKADVSSRKKRKKREKASASDDSSKGCLVEESNGDDSAKLLISHRYKGKKRGRAFDRNTRAAELDSGYISKVQQLGKIKQKQDEDKAAARLHSFNGSCVVSEAVNPTSGPIEKMTSLRFTNLAPKVKPPDVQNYMPVSDQEIVLCVEIYHPRRTWVKTQEFLVLGRQTLTELRDRIYCLTDQLMQKAEQHDPSGYFLIEDVFCNDLRDPSAIDYSKPIFDWLRNSKDDALKKWEWIYSGELLKEQKKLLGNTRIPNLPHFKTIEMQKVRFYDLKFRLGGGYLYCHQGDCKHLFVIRDMRLIHPEDVQNRAAYPVVTFQLKTRFNKCSVCTLFRATKVTVDDKWAGKNPCYFCDNCYFLLHYNEDGTLLYDNFTVYDYHHDGD